MTLTTEPGAAPGLSPQQLAEATARLARYGAQRCGERTRYQNGAKWRRFVAFQAAHPDLPLADVAQAWLSTIPASNQAIARTVLKIALGATACDWSALMLRRYHRNELRLTAGIFREAARAKVRAAVTGPRELALVECLWVLRRCEVAALRWGDLDVTRGMVTVRHGKGDKPSWTLLPPSTHAALRAWFEAARTPGDDTPVFPIQPGTGHPRHVGGPYSPGGLGKLVRRILIRAGLWTPGSGICHRFRRSFATQYIRTNPGDLAGLQRLMRHTQLSTTGRYLYLEPEDLAPRMAALEL